MNVIFEFLSSKIYYLRKKDTLLTRGYFFYP
nr:MAG TPA: hypothetical protein [Caudoviricetes sp.]